jgi:hypothetical protein
MKRLLLLIALFTLLALPALADDSNSDDGKTTDGEVISLGGASGSYEYADGTLRDTSRCMRPEHFLDAISVFFRTPTKVPEAYLIRWTARNNGTWRAKDKPNTAKAGNWLIKHTHLGHEEGFTFVGFGQAGLRHPHTHVYRLVNGEFVRMVAAPAVPGVDMRIPVNQPVKVLIRPMYGERKGPKLEFTFNTPELTEAENVWCKP